MFVITGGGSGIGRALAFALAKQKKSVCIIGRDEVRLKEVAALHPLISYFVADVSKPLERQQIVTHVSAFGPLEGLVHNAGTIEPIMPLLHLSPKEWQQVMAVNVEAPLFLTQGLQSVLSGSRVLHIGSGAAYFPIQGWSAYCVSKAALSMLTRAFQLEVQDIYVASVMPGIIDTPMQAKIRQSSHMNEDKLDFFKRLKASNRLLQPETVALFLSWLLLSVPKDVYISKEWDIYDSSHHQQWLVAPHSIPSIEN